MTGLICRVQEYLERKYGQSRPDLLCRIYMRRIEHLYYKVRGEGGEGERGGGKGEDGRGKERRGEG